MYSNRENKMTFTTFNFNSPIPSKSSSYIIKCEYSNNRDDYDLYNIQSAIESNCIKEFPRLNSYYSNTVFDADTSKITDILNKHLSERISVNVSIVISELYEYLITKGYNKDECKHFIRKLLSNEDRLGLKYRLELHKRDSKKSSLTFVRDDSIPFNSFIPMVIEPRPWNLDEFSNNAYCGGFIHGENSKASLIRNSAKHNYNSGGKHNFKLSQDAVDVVNNLQRLSIKSSFIEPSIHHLQDQIESVNRKISNLENPSSKSSKRIKYILKSEMEVHMYHLKAYQYAHEIYNKHQVENVFFCYKVDFRGRIYVSNLISPTSTKHIRDKLINNSSTLKEFDAKASVLQVLGTITMSKKLLKLTGFEGHEEIDAWSSILNDVLKCKELHNGIDISIISREMVKFTIMRTLYGSNSFTIASSFRIDENRCSCKHINLILDVFKSEFKHEFDVMKILRKVSSLYYKVYGSPFRIDGKYISFDNYYRKSAEDELNFEDSNGKAHRVSFQIETTAYDARKSSNAICPNFFHSIDSSVCMDVIKDFMNNKLGIITIHDAFMIDPINIRKLNTSYNYHMLSHNDTLRNLLYRNDLCHPKILNITKELRNELDKRLIEFQSNYGTYVNSNYTLKC